MHKSWTDLEDVDKQFCQHHKILLPVVELGAPQQAYTNGKMLQGFIALGRQFQDGIAQQ